MNSFHTVLYLLLYAKWLQSAVLYMFKSPWAAINADPLSYVRQMVLGNHTLKKRPLCVNSGRIKDWGWGGGEQ